MLFSPGNVSASCDTIDVYAIRWLNSSRQDIRVAHGYFNCTSQTAITRVRMSKLRNETFYYIGIFIVGPGQMNKTEADIKSGTVLVKYRGEGKIKYCLN